MYIVMDLTLDQNPSFGSHPKNRWCLWTLNDLNHRSPPEPMQVVAIKRIKLNPDDDEGIPPGDLMKG